MADIKGTLGATLWISNTVLTDTSVDTEVEFWAYAYTQVGFVENFGEFGKMFDLVTFQPVYDGRTYKLKGGYNSGTMSVVVGTDLDDAGQSALATAADAANQNRRAFRIILGDKTTYYGAGSIYYFSGLPMSFRNNLGTVNNVFRSTVNIEVDGDIFYLPPGELFDMYEAGDSLAHWNFFAGTDPQAIAPAIVGGNLQMVTGNAGTGIAADGTEAVADSTDLTFQLNSLTTNLVFVSRFRIDDDISAAFFIGLTDNNASLEMPIHFPSATLTTVASDAVGFVYDSAAGDAFFRCVGVRQDVDETTIVSAVPLVIGTFYTLEMVINPAADTNFYIDGVLIGTMTTATRVLIDLFPCMVGLSRNTTSSTGVIQRTYVNAT